MRKTTLQQVRSGGFLDAVVVAAWRLGMMLAVLFPAANVAQAQDRNGVTVKTEYYEITGTNPQQLLVSMLKRGPKDGFHSRALAQTKYHTEWQTKIAYSGSKCRVVEATTGAEITYIYPRPPAGLSKAVKRRWDRFMTGLMRHERQHGKYVRQMLVQARKSVLGLHMEDGEKCSKTRAEMRRRVRAAHDSYEARQVAFDKKEHSDGGEIDRLIAAFVRPL